MGYSWPRIQILMASDAPRAVIVANYGERSSRMILWETDRDVFHPGQWLKAAIRLLDVSPDGRFVAYYVAAPYRAVQSYIAVSKPPFLTALFFRPVSSLDDYGATFDAKGGFLWQGVPENGSRLPDHPEYGEGRIEPNPPFNIERVEDFSNVECPSWEREAARLSSIPTTEWRGLITEEMLLRPWKEVGVRLSLDQLYPRTPPYAFEHSSLWRANWDHQGRLIVTDRRGVSVYREESFEPVELLDLTQTTWSFMPPPEWARRW